MHELQARCLHGPVGSQKLEFSFDCFLYKLGTDVSFFLIAAICFTLILFDVMLNSLIIASVLLVKERPRKRVDLCFMSNAIADLLMGLVIMPFSAIYTLFGYIPQFNFSCFIWNCLDFGAGTASMLHIAFISYDRYLSVSEPMKYTSKNSRDRSSSTGRIPTQLVLFFLWFFAAAVWVPILLVLKTSYSEPNLDTPHATNSSFGSELALTNQFDQCLLPTPSSIIVPHSIFVYYLPMFFIVFFYTKTIIIVNNKMIKQPKLQKKRVVDSEGSDEIVKPPTEENEMLAKPAKAQDCKLIEPLLNPLQSPSIQITRASSNNDEDSAIKNSSTKLDLSYAISPMIQISLVPQATSCSLNSSDTSCRPLTTPIEPSPNLDEEGTDQRQVPNDKQESTARNVNVKKLTFRLTRCSIDEKHLPEVKIGDTEQDQRGKRNTRSTRKLRSFTVSFVAQKRFRKEKNITYKLGIIMATFVLCWLPFCLMWPLSSVCSDCLPPNIYLSSFWLAYLNSIFTPLLLLYNNKKYRRSWYILCRLCKCRDDYNSSFNQTSFARSDFQSIQDNMKYSTNRSAKNAKSVF
nr:G protein-coupled receptor [Proales similis]